MSTPSFLTLADQVTEHLRSEILRGRWSGALPGKHQLAAELGVNNKTVEGALRQLEKTGLLLPRGAGRSEACVKGITSASRWGGPPSPRCCDCRRGQQMAQR